MLTTKGKIPLCAMMILLFLLLCAVLTVYFNYKYANLPAPSKTPGMPANEPANASDGSLLSMNLCRIIQIPP